MEMKQLIHDEKEQEKTCLFGIQVRNQPNSRNVYIRGVKTRSGRELTPPWTPRRSYRKDPRHELLSTTLAGRLTPELKYLHLHKFQKNSLQQHHHHTHQVFQVQVQKKRKYPVQSLNHQIRNHDILHGVHSRRVQKMCKYPQQLLNLSENSQRKLSSEHTIQNMKMIVIWKK